MTKSRVILAGSILLTAILGLIGYWMLFTQFMVYDDEGYVLWSLRTYCTEGGLYERVFSQYGPFFFTYYHLLQVISGLSFDNESGRLLTLGYWCGIALLCGLFTWRQTQALLAAFATTCLTFASLLLMTSEPIHPGGLLALIAAWGTIAGANAIAKQQETRLAIIVGFVGAAMVLTKINVGSFFALAAGSWLAINTRFATLSRPAAWLTALGSVAVPLVLMWSHWPSPWVTTYMLIFSCGALTLGAALHDMRQPEHGLRSWSLGLGVMGGLTALVIAAVWAQGTNLAKLWEGAVLAPLRHPNVYAFQGTWQPGAREAALGFALFATIYYFFFRRTTWISLVIATLRIGASLWFFTKVTHADEGWLHRFNFDYGPSLAWLMAVPLSPGQNTPVTRASLWLAWVFVWQVLQAYPVAGSQTSWGSFLWVPLCIVGWHEAIACWMERYRPAGQVFRATSGLVLLGIGIMAIWPIARLGHARYVLGQPIGLPGATHLRIADNFTTSLRIFNQNIRTHAGTLFSYPGMFSFNIWTGRPTPTSANVTHWFSLLSESQQRAIIARLEADRRAVVMTNRFLINYLIETGFPPHGILKDYLVKHFVPALRLDTYELWVHRGRKIAPLSTARITTSPSVAGHLRLELVVGALAHPVAAIELRQLNPPYTLIERVSPNSLSPWLATPLNLDSSEIEKPTQHDAPFAVAATSLITAEFSPASLLPPLAGIEVHLFDASHVSLARLRFNECSQ